jgi:5-methylcytosine-specific restriction endonuclease McrA
MLFEVSRRKGRRASNEECRRFASFLQKRLTEKEAAAFLVAVARSKGLPWSSPRRETWQAIANFCRRHVGVEELVAFAHVIDRRLASGQPAIRPELLRQDVEADEDEEWSLAADAAPPESFDDWLEQRLRGIRGEAERRHFANRQTDCYRALRARRLVLAGHRCETPRCGETSSLQLHHLHYGTFGTERLDDVMMLCDECHIRVTQRQRAERRARWRPIGTRRVRRPF